MRRDSADRVPGDDFEGRGLGDSPVGRRQHQRHDLEQVAAPDGLVEIAPNTEPAAALAIAPLARGGQHDEPRRRQRRVTLHRCGQSEAIHVGHLSVNDGEVVGSRCVPQGVERFRGPGRLPDDHSFGAQDLAEQHAIGGVVVHNQHPHTLERPDPHDRRGARPGGLDGEGEREREFAAAVRLTRDSEVTPHECDKPVGDREAQARTPKRRVIEGSAWVNSWNTAASLSGAMPIPVSRTSKRNCARASGNATADTETTTSPASVNLMAFPMRFVRTWRIRTGSPRTNSGTSDATCADKFQLLFSGAHGKEADRAVDQAMHVEGDLLQLDVRGLDLGEVEHIVQDREQGFGGDPHRIEIAALLRAEIGIEDDLEQPEHRVHRRANFVAHVREEARLGAVGALRAIAGHGELQRLRRELRDDLLLREMRRFELSRARGHALVQISIQLA